MCTGLIEISAFNNRPVLHFFQPITSQFWILTGLLSFGWLKEVLMVKTSIAWCGFNNIAMKRWKKLRCLGFRYIGFRKFCLRSSEITGIKEFKKCKSPQLRFQNCLESHFGYPSAKLDAMLIMMMRFPIWHLPVSPSECCCNSSMPDSAKCTT